MKRVISDFTKGVQINGQHAAPGSFVELQNMRHNAGRLEMLPGSKEETLRYCPVEVTPIGDTGAAYTRIELGSTDATITSIDKAIFSKRNGLLWYKPRNLTEALPIWSRFAENPHIVDGGEETISSIGDGFVFSPTKHDSALLYPTHSCLYFTGKMILIRYLTPRKLYNPSGNWQNWDPADPNHPTFNTWTFPNLYDTPVNTLPDGFPFSRLCGFKAFLGSAASDGKSFTVKRQSWLHSIQLPDPNVNFSGWLGVEQIFNGKTLTAYERLLLSQIDCVLLLEIAPIGIPKMDKPNVAVSSTVGTLPNGTYRYCTQYYSSELGHGGVPSDASAPVTTTGTQSVAFDVNASWHSDLKKKTSVPPLADLMRLYRSQYISGAWTPWALVQEYPTVVKRFVGDAALERYERKVSWYNPDTAPTIDTGFLNGEFMPGDAYRHERPGLILKVRHWNNKLYGVENPSKLRFSSTMRPHSWPTAVYDTTSADDLLHVGGQVLVGGQEAIEAIIPEGSSFGNTGIQGDALLVFKRSATYRWHGTDWSNFRLTQALSIGTKDGRSCQSTPGATLFMGPEHVMRLPFGEETAQVVSNALDPIGIARQKVEWRTAYLFDKYILDNGWMMDTTSGEWTRIKRSGFVPFNITPFVIETPDFGPDLIHYRPNLSWYWEDPKIDRFFYRNPAKKGYPETAVTCICRTRKDSFADQQDHLLRRKWFKRLWCAVTNDSGRTQQIKIGMWISDNVDVGIVKEQTFTVPCCGSYNPNWPHIIGPVEINAHGFFGSCHLEMAFVPRDTSVFGQFTPDTPLVAVEWFVVEYEPTNMVTEAT